MPIYTYECPKGHRFELLAKIPDKEVPCIHGAFMNTTVYVENPNQCKETAVRIPSVPSPAQFNCSMPTYQRKKT